MGSVLVAQGKTKSGNDYRIYNIDNIYTVYMKIEIQVEPDGDKPKSVYSAFHTFKTLKEAKEYVSKKVI